MISIGRVGRDAGPAYATDGTGRPRHHERMPLFAFEGQSPAVSPQAWIAPTATLVGDVRVEALASVWYGAVLRGRLRPDHRAAGAPTFRTVRSCTAAPIRSPRSALARPIGHLCVVHSALIGEEALVGNGATVLDGAVIGAARPGGGRAARCRQG